LLLAVFPAGYLTMQNLPSMQELAIKLELPDAVVYGVANQTYAITKPAIDLFAQGVNAVPVLKTVMDAADAYTKSVVHPFCTKLPLMTPMHVLFAVFAYFAMLPVLYVIGKATGKLQLKFFGILHNGFLYSVSLYMCVAIGITAAASGFTLWNNAVQGDTANGWRLAKLIWLFYVSKLPEYIDTFIMMGKHNFRQVSFLHLYHHSTIFVIWFIVTAETPGGEAYFSAMLNSGIHVIMYGYYLGTALFPTGPIRRFLNSIKFFITYGQMTQFSLNCVQSMYGIFGTHEKKFPRHMFQLLLVYMVTLLALFGNFLIRNQGAAKKAAADKKKKKQ
jgi:elongation of very long chain fatty acids protein 4